jgi:2-polyprenyl-3-methyl-5-hydroxy-6-metoxy-1,4-benzoquinol methylase
MPVPAAHDDAIRCAPSPRCLACGGGGVGLYQELQDHLSGAPGRWHMVQCADPGCALLWLDPKPLQADLIKAYASYHTHGRQRGRSATDLGLSALNATCKLASHALELGSALGRQRRQLRTMFLGGGAPGRLLEVGCGSGRFLDRMRRAGWAVQGTDIDPVVAARIRRRYAIDIDVGELQSLRYAADSFDAVALSQVIEHVYDPRQVLAECRRVLRPGGRLVLATPNARSVAHRRYGRSWRGLEPPRHLHIFTAQALARCATDAGLRVQRLQTLSAESAGIYRASDALRAAESPPAGGSAAWSVLRSWWLRYAEYRQSCRDADAGQDIFLIAEK